MQVTREGQPDMIQERPKPPHLEPSSLGTKEYWDSLYTTELNNHASDPSDIGTIWFDDSAAEDKVLAYLRSEELGLDREKTTFLDVGTGNGHFLLRLREGGDEQSDKEEVGQEYPDMENGKSATESFTGRMMGTDYSVKSVDFAKRLALSKGFTEIEFILADIMKSDLRQLVLTGINKHGWDVVLDKGTFDAISLSSETDELGRRIADGYKERIVSLVKNGGVFVVTSCNWAEEELGRWFDGGGFEKVGEVRYRSFCFGGRKGQTISTVCFRKVGSR